MTAAGMVRIATIADVCLNMDGTNTYMFVYPSGEVLEVNASQMATVGQGMALVIPAWEFRSSTDVKLVLMDGDMFARDDDQVSKILHRRSEHAEAGGGAAEAPAGWARSE